MPEPLIDRRLLETLERLTIRWRKSFRGLVGGHNPSRYSGAGQEFLDHRHFHEGDDLRAVNWRAYLRLEKLFLKMFEVEPRTPIRMLIDASASMTASASPDEPAKFDYARRLAAALVYVGLVRHDTITLHSFHDRLDEPHTASGGRHRFGPVADYLTELAPRGKTDFLELARQFLAVYPHPGLLIIISDFLDDADCLRPLQYLAEFGNELMLLQLWTPSEREPRDEGDLRLADAETGERLQLTLDAAARRAYTEAFDDYAERVADLALRNGGRYFGLSTGTPLEEAVFRALEHAGRPV